MKKLILGVMAAVTLVTSAPAFAWNQTHCQTAMGHTRAQQGKLLKECQFKFSRHKYEGILNNYIKGNGGKDSISEMPIHVVNRIKEAQWALHGSGRVWPSEDYQNDVEFGKRTAILTGSALAVLGLIVFGAPVGAPVLTTSAGAGAV